MNLKLVQFEPLLDDKANNEKKITKFLETIYSDIIVFPELATSGYYFTDKQILYQNSYDKNSDFIKELQKICDKKQSVIILGAPEKSGENIFNSAFIFRPNEEILIYRKSHLFYKEFFVFTPGNTGFFVFDFKGIRIGTMICYDWRFPEAARSLALLKADLIVCPSNLVTGVWQNVMSARALENKVYVAVCNRIGKEEKNEDVLLFNGESTIYSYTGQILSKSSKDTEEIISTDLDFESTRDKSFNKFNDIFADRRPDLYL